MKKMLNDELSQFGKTQSPILFPEHHLSHAASAFYPSPFNEAAILTIDGTGEWATTTISRGIGNDIEILKELHFPHSVGLLYSAFTYYLGFTVNSGEYKLMGLAPYGDPDSDQTKEFSNKIFDNLIDIREDGSFLLNMDYFDFAHGLRMTNNRKWNSLFGFPRREPESELGQSHADLALAIQNVTEKIIIKLANHAREITGCRYLTMAGGVALNCVANGKLFKTGCFEDIWVQPAAGDAGGAIGAALAAWHIFMDQPREIVSPDGMNGALLGPEYTDKEILMTINKFQAEADFFDDFDALCDEVSYLIDKGKVIGWFQGRMEFGPRALGNRSILADPRNPEIQSNLNLKIKFRESFRPFAPAVLEDDVTDYFDFSKPSPYMLFTAPVNISRLKPVGKSPVGESFMQQLSQKRSDIPAVTHIDYSARFQSVDPVSNKRFHQLLQKFKKLTHYGILVNTSFNVRGEPIVCSPEDAYRCFMSTGMDYLVIGNYLFDKQVQLTIKFKDGN